MEKITTVFLDIDNTLWWFQRNSAVALERTMRHFGVEQLCPVSQFVAMYLEVNAALWERYHHGEISKEFLLAERFERPLAHFGCKGDVSAVAAAMNEWYLADLAEQKQLLPGAVQLLDYLQGRGYRLCTLSNGFAGTQQRKLESGGILHYFELNVLSDDCGITKPQRGIFNYALQQAGVSADEVVMIGDNPDADILGAHQAGWRTIYFNLGGVPAVPGTATHTVTSLAEITTIL